MKNVHRWRHGNSFYVQAVEDDVPSPCIFEYPVTIEGEEKMYKAVRDFKQAGYSLFLSPPPGWEPPE